MDGFWISFIFRQIGNLFNPSNYFRIRNKAFFICLFSMIMKLIS